MIFFVYKLTFSNGKIYIGMTRSDKRGRTDNRYRQHSWEAARGKDLPIYHAWRKHGAPMQTILATCETRDACAIMEIDAIIAFDACNPDKGYNLMRGGEGLNVVPGTAMYQLMRERVWNNTEVRRKLSEANKGKPPSPQAIAAANEQRATPEGRAALRKGWEKPGRRERMSELTRQQMANGGAEHLSNVTKGRVDPRTPEGKERQRQASIKHANSGHAGMMRAVAFTNPETVRKFEEGRAAWRNSDKNAEHCRAMAQLAAQACNRPVRDNSTGSVYPSQQAMAAALGVSGATISRKVKAGKFERL